METTLQKTEVYTAEIPLGNKFVKVLTTSITPEDLAKVIQNIQSTFANAAEYNRYFVMDSAEGVTFANPRNISARNFRKTSSF